MRDEPTPGARRIRRAFVVGAGLAGLGAALRLAEAGIAVTVAEATAAPGGRCRSFFDARLDRWIDNGNHLILSGNTAVLAHARRIGSAERLAMEPEAAFPFVDLGNGSRWTVRLPRAGLPELPPGARAADLVDLARLLLAPGRQNIAGVVRRRGALWGRLWEPLVIAVLNAPPEGASAALMRAALLRTVLRGAAACRPVFAPGGLGPALVEPAVERLRAMGATLRMRAPLEGIGFEGGRAAWLAFGDGGRIALGVQDVCVLAVAPGALGKLLPDLVMPLPGLPILNAHYRVAPGLAERAPPLLGLVGGAAQWVFRRGDVLSVTVSAEAAGPLAGLDRDAALALLWRDVAAALSTTEQPLAARLLRERAATFDQSPDGVARRLPARSPWPNLVFAGDHTATGLPASLEGALRSAEVAAGVALGRDRSG